MRKVGENANVECSSFSSCAALFFLPRVRCTCLAKRYKGDETGHVEHQRYQSNEEATERYFGFPAS